LGKKVVFLVHHSHADTSHKVKKVQKKILHSVASSILLKKEKRKKRRRKKEEWPTNRGAEPTHSRPLTLRLATPLILAGQINVHLLRQIPDSFRVKFQNLGFSFKSKNDF
jgi:hypothetical protein